jgi:hypothetical protein
MFWELARMGDSRTIHLCLTPSAEIVFYSK